MTRRFGAVLSYWLDQVAATIVAACGWFVSPRVLQFIETDDGSAFLVRVPSDRADAALRVQFPGEGIAAALPPDLLKAARGGRIEMTLRPSRFVFKQIELPRRAVEFLDGIVRAQIDRLTPWAAADAVFGWGRPIDIAKDRIAITVAATAGRTVKPLLQAIFELGASSVAILTSPVEGAIAPSKIKVYDQSGGGVLDVRRVSRILRVLLLAALVAAGAAIAADWVVGGNLAAKQAALAKRISESRAFLRASLDGSGQGPAALLDRRKRETAATVIVLEALSDILPDHTYVTELHVEGDRMQLVGVTHDAPELIRLIEESPHFTRATFFAPTTSSASEPGERFHIEAHVEPVNTPGN